MKKQLISFFLIFSLLLSLLPLGAGAAEHLAEGSCTDTIQWALSSDGTMTVSGTGAIPDYEIGEQPWRPYRNSIKRVVVESGITRIGNRAFQTHKSLQSAVIGKDVAVIGKYAFQNCYALTEIDLSPSVQFETGAFRSAAVEFDVHAAQETPYEYSSFYQKLSDVALSGNYREDVISIALSQLGYHEGDSPADYAGENQSGSKNFVEFGRCVGSVGSDWCSEFAHWCVRMAGVPMQVLAISRNANPTNFTKDTSSKFYTWTQTTYGGGSYTPQKGDLLLWAWDYDDHTDNEALSHTSIFNGLTNNGDGTLTIHSIDGNLSGKVRTKDYTLRSANGTLTSQKGCLYYIVSPDYARSSIETHRVTFSSDGSSIGSKTVADGAFYGALPMPKKAGATFLGWYTRPDGGSRVSTYTPVRLSADQTLYAHWKVSGTMEQFSWSFDMQTAALTVTGEVGAGETLLAAGYDCDGRMLSVRAVTASGQQLLFAGDCKSVKLFLTGTNSKPKCTSANITR